MAENGFSFFHDSGWREHPDYPHAQWQEAVAQEETRQGYAAWVAANHEKDRISFQAADPLECEPHAAFLAQWEERFPVEEWMGQVAELDTRLGYGVWVSHQVELMETEEEEDVTD